MARDREIDDIMQDKVGKFRDRVEENIDKIKDRVDEARERFDEIREKGEEGWKDVSQFTRKNPGQALGLAIVVGAALGVLLFGGRNRD